MSTAQEAAVTPSAVVIEPPLETVGALGLGLRSLLAWQEEERKRSRRGR